MSSAFRRATGTKPSRRKYNDNVIFNEIAGVVLKFVSETLSR